MDDADRAEVIQGKQRQRSIDAITQRQHETPLHNDDNQRICCDCDSVIPEARMVAAPRAVRCIRCQRDVERWP